MNNLVQTGYQTTKPNQIGTRNTREGKEHNPDREKTTAGSLLTRHRPAYDPPPAETATACTTGAEDATGGETASIALVHKQRGAKKQRDEKLMESEERPNEEENDEIRRAP